MFRTVFLFEFHYRKKRSATYIYAGIIFLLCFLGVISPNIKLGSPLGQIYANAPYIIYRMTLVASFGLLIVNAAIMGVTIVRDTDHQMESLLFSTPLTKWNYLMGRFWGSFSVLVLIHTMFPLGFICGFLVGNAVPWELSWRGQTLLPFDPSIYFHSFFLILVPNLFITSSLFFMSGTLSRNAIVIYSQGIFFLILYQITYGFLKGMDEQTLAALIDPLGIQTFTYVTRYWTSAEQNTAFLPLDGMMLYNRLLWIGIGFVLLVITYYRFSFVMPCPSNKNDIDTTPESALNLRTRQAVFAPVFTTQTYLNQLSSLAFSYFRMTWKEVPFLAIVSSGVVLFFLGVVAMNAGYGNNSYPTTSMLLGQIDNSFELFLLIIAIFYSGELIWKERSVHMQSVSDSLPVSSLIQLLSKFLGLLLVYAIILLGLIFCCVIIQVINGYYVFELPVYFGTLYLALFTDLFLYTIIFLFIQVIINNKFLGFTLCIAFVIINALLEQMGLKHGLWKYASGTLGRYSMMDAYDHFIIPFAWFKSYWLALSGLMLVAAVVFSVRGTDTSISSRWKAGKQRFTRSLLVFTLSMTVVLFICGAFIYTSTTSHSVESPQPSGSPAQKYDADNCLSSPSITSIHLSIELYPSLHQFDAKGFYYLTNKSDHPIQHIPIQHSADHRLHIQSLKFDRKIKEEEVPKDARYIVYELISSLLPGDSLRMDFQLSFQSGDFDDPTLTPVVIHNGSFLDHSFFPTASYQKKSTEEEEIKNADEPCGQKNTTDRALFIDAVIGTENDQAVVAPGKLQKKWEENGRNYFHYKTKKVIRFSYFFASARYRRLHERWNNIDLEIYYHPAHTYNLQAMMKGMKDGLAYCSENFSSYPFRQLCIIELPFFSTPPASYSGIIPFSENKEFIFRHNDSLDVDMAYEQTVREVANQWWRHQVIPAKMKGDKLLTDGLPAYTTLMILKHAYPGEAFNRYVSEQGDRYKKARNADKQKEQPLELVASQPHVQQNKAAIAFYALQDYLGETRLNAALRGYRQTWSASNGSHPTSGDFLHELSRVIPDTLRPFYYDLFQSVTLYENSTRDVVYRENKRNEFEIFLSLSCEKTRMNANGQEEKIPIDDWIDVGVYSTGTIGQDTLIYLRKHRIVDKDKLITITVKNKPVRAGIDPLHKLLDNHPLDNVQAAVPFMEIPNLEVDF